MNYRVAVLGATGNVGREILAILKERKFPFSSLHALASDKIPNRKVSFGEDRLLLVESAEKFDFSKVDLVLASPGSAVSKVYGPKAAKAGAVYIDNSSAFRMETGVPLIVPEVNGDKLSYFRKKNIIASPNCVAIPLTMALKPLHDLATLKRVILSSYQSISGAGRAAMAELMSQTKATLMNMAFKIEYCPKQIAFNIFPHIGNFDSHGHTDEETKIIQETKKILGPDIKISATSVRVPTFIGHAISATVEFTKEISVGEARQALKAFSGIELVDNVKEDRYITPIDCVGHDQVFVSRVRKDPSCPKSLILWIVSDNLRKGAALNTVQIAEHLIKLLPLENKEKIKRGSL